jgi:Lactate dehydrogenase and related dehydrogenases
MKIFVYSCRSDEAGYFETFGEKYGAELTLCKGAPTLETAELAKGFECISIITSKIDAALLKKFYEVGVRYISTRTIGFDHIDIKSADALGMQVGNITYSPGSVAEYTVMLILMALRKAKAILQRSNVQDYSLRGVQGRELHNLTVGVIGTGRIGRTVIRNLSGFGCSLLAYDLYPDEETKRYAEYVPLEQLFAQSDVITMHVPAAKDNFHLVNKDTIAKMKDGVILINTARGSLIDTQDFIDGVESGKIGGAALDVVEDEFGLYYNDLKCKVLKNRGLALLRSYPNVLVTPHTAFYTDQAVSDMVENSIKSCVLFLQKRVR